MVVDGVAEGEDLVLEFAADGGAGVGVGVGVFAFHAAFVGDEEAALAFEVEVAAAVVAGLEVLGGVEGAVGEEVEGEGVGYRGAEGFDEVEGEGGAVVLGLVVEAEGGVEAVGVKEGVAFCGEECVGVGEDGVGGIEGWAAGAADEGNVGGEEGGVGLEVEAGGCAFVAAEGFEALCGEGVLGVLFEGVEDGVDLGLGAVGGEALEDAALVEDFGFDECDGDGEGELGVLGALVLGVEGGAEGCGVLEEGEELAVVVEDDDGELAAGEFGKGGEGDGGAFVEEEAFDVADVDGVGGGVVFGCVGWGDEEAFAFELDACAGGGEVECGHGELGVRS